MEKDTKKVDDNFKFKVIDPKAVVSIKMSTSFYIRLKQAVIHMVKDKSKEELEKANKQIEENNITEEWVIHLETMYILLAEFDKQASDANLFIEKTKEQMEEDLKKVIKN